MSLKASAVPAVAMDVSIVWSVCLSVTLVHAAEAVGGNKLPFGNRDGTLQLGGGFSPCTGREDLGVGNPVKIYLTSCGKTVAFGGQLCGLVPRGVTYRSLCL